MTYPGYDDFAERERARARERAARRADDEARFRATGVCARVVRHDDEARGPCLVCQHADALHPGWFNPDPDLVACVACALKNLGARVNVRLLAAELPPAEPGGEHDLAPRCCPDYPSCSH